MNSKLVLSAIGITLLGSVAGVFAQGQQPQQPMSFFVTSKTPNGTGNLGGLAGADQICQNLAASAGAGNRTWRAYLSTEARPNQPAVNARGRIGPGPWYNAKGILIAGSVADLHGDNQRDRNAIRQANVLDEKGQMVPCGGGGVCEHDILTGSDSMGRAFTDGTDHTCMNWTSDAMTVPPTADQAKEGVPASRARAMLGHSDRGLNPGPGNISWNAAHMSQGCTKQALINSGGSGRFYCLPSTDTRPARWGPGLPPGPILLVVKARQAYSLVDGGWPDNRISDAYFPGGGGRPGSRVTHTSGR